MSGSSHQDEENGDLRNLRFGVNNDLIKDGSEGADTIMHIF